jgi:hypothetical protein
MLGSEKWSPAAQVFVRPQPGEVALDRGSRELLAALGADFVQRERRLRLRARGV